MVEHKNFEMCDFIVVNYSSDRISWKKTAERLLKKLNEEQHNTYVNFYQGHETEYLCPYCNDGKTHLLETGSGEIYCENKDCKFDKVPGDYWDAIALKYDIEESSD